jgi:hypothetical protein
MVNGNNTAETGKLVGMEFRSIDLSAQGMKHIEPGQVVDLITNSKFASRASFPHNFPAYQFGGH